jgi:hypothetical protein
MISMARPIRTPSTGARKPENRSAPARIKEPRQAQPSCFSGNCIGLHDKIAETMTNGEKHMRSHHHHFLRNLLLAGVAIFAAAPAIAADAPVSADR